MSTDNARRQTQTNTLSIEIDLQHIHFLVFEDLMKNNGIISNIDTFEIRLLITYNFIFVCHLLSFTLLI